MQKENKNLAILSNWNVNIEATKNNFSKKTILD